MRRNGSPDHYGLNVSPQNSGVNTPIPRRAVVLEVRPLGGGEVGGTEPLRWPPG